MKCPLISCPLLAKLHRNLVRGKHDCTTSPFANIDVLFVGDFNQFPPVKSTPLYYGSHPETPMKPVTSQNDVDRELGRCLWSQLTHAILLTEQNRVVDNKYADILKRLAEGKCTPHDHAVLNTRLIDNVDINTTKFLDAPVVVPGNRLRNEVNKFYVNKYAASIGQMVVTSIAIDSCTKFQLTASKLKLLQNLSYTSTSNLPGELPLFIGMKVMLTTNLLVEEKLANGSVGEVTRIACTSRPILKENKYVLQEQPRYVVVNFHNTSCPTFESLNPGEVPIFPLASTFRHKFPGSLRPTSIRRQQLPLVACYSYTAHKAQCKTLDAVITDLVPPPGFKVDSGFSYVPLSRVRRLDDLCILRPFPIKVLQTQQPLDLVAQDKRFEEMDLS